MAFGATSVLDNFNRADGNVGAGWTVFKQVSGTNPFTIASNQLAYGLTTFNFEYWNAATYGPDCEAYITIATQPDASEQNMLFARLNDVGAENTWDGYGVFISDVAATETWQTRRYDNAVSTQLGASFTQAVNNGDSFGIECIGSTIKAYYKASGGSWTELASRTDATYGAAGYLGLYGSVNQYWRSDDFGGGTIAAGGDPEGSLIGGKLLRGGLLIHGVLTRG